MQGFDTGWGNEGVWSGAGLDTPASVVSIASLPTLVELVSMGTAVGVAKEAAADELESSAGGAFEDDFTVVGSTN